jgi:hypothetical protein
LHQLEFKQGAKVLKYAPPKPPLGFVSEKQYSLDGIVYFVTGWAHGPSTILYRVFAPGISGAAQPICEVASLSEKAELKAFGEKIKISAHLKEGGAMTWVDCGRRSKNQKISR